MDTERLPAPFPFGSPRGDSAPPARIDNFDVEGKIGAGAMGTVYRARQRSVGRPVALKILSPRAAPEPEDVERFVREARVAAAVAHPNVVKVYDAGVDAASGAPFIAYELVEGEDLESAAARVPRFDERRALEVGLAICRGLVGASSAGIVHRDIKPSNVLLSRDGAIKIADLGMAKAQWDGDLTRTGEILGTPAYMSPEQALGAPVDARSDLYAVGLIVYRLATGARALVGESVIDTLTRRQTEDVPDPRVVAPELSEAFAAVIARLCARRADARPATAADAVALIERALAGSPRPRAPRPISSRRARPPRAAHVAPGGATGLVLGIAAGAGALALVLAMVVRASRELVDPRAGADAARSPPDAARVDPVEPAPEPAEARTAPPPPPEIGRGIDDPSVYRAFLRTEGCRLVHVLGRHGLKHAGYGMRVRLSADGERILSLSADGEMAVCGFADGRELDRRMLPRSGRQVVQAADISGDGRWVFAGTPTGEVLCYDVTGRDAPVEPVSRLAVHRGKVNDLDVALAGHRLVTCGDDGRLVVVGFDPSTAELRIERDLPFDQGPMNDVATDATVTRVAVGLGPIEGRPARGRILDIGVQPTSVLAAGDRIGVGGFPRSAMSRDGTRALVGHEPGGLIRPVNAVVWKDGPDGVERELREHRNGVRSVAVAPDGRLGATGDAMGAGRVIIWDLDTLEPIADLAAHATLGGSVADIALGESGRMVTMGADGIVRRWDVSGGAEVGGAAVVHAGRTLGVSAGGPAGAGVVATLGDDGVRVWDAAGEWTHRFGLAAPPGAARVVAVAPDGRAVVAGGRNGEVARADLRPGAPPEWSATRRVEGSAGVITALAIDRRGVLVAADDGGGLTAWDTEADGLENQRGLARLSSPAVSVDFDRSGGLVIVTRDGKVRGLRLDVMGASARSLRSEDGAPIAAGLSPDAKHLLVVGERGWSLFDRASESRVVGGDAIEPRAAAHVAWSPDSRRVVMAAGREVRALEVGPPARSVASFRLDAPGRYVATGAAFDPDGRTFYVSTVRGSVLAFELDD